MTIEDQLYQASLERDYERALNKKLERVMERNGLNKQYCAAVDECDKHCKVAVTCPDCKHEAYHIQEQQDGSRLYGCRGCNKTFRKNQP